jgi:arylsulfatase A-like enzyme
MQVAGYQSEVVAKRWAGWVCAQREERRPMFSVVSIEAPHPPYAAPAAGVMARTEGEIALNVNVPRGGEAESKARRELAGYYAHIEATDRALAGVWERTKENWIVVFTSVHGDMHGAHGLFRKGWPQEESVRVPWLVRAPGVKARRDEAAVSLVDLAGMTTAWAEGRAGPADGRIGAEISMPSLVALPHQCDREWRGVRTKTRKLVLGPDGTPWLFFDLADDPLEMRNLAGDPARSGEMAALRVAAGLV